MNQIINGFVGRVFRIRIEGQINQELANAVTRGLQSSWPYKPEALLVTINSAGGSLSQAKNISDLLRLQGNKRNVPIVCFVQDQCLGAANIILTTGVRCYANSFSLIGDVGYIWNRLWYKDFAEKYNVKTQYVYAGENKVKLNPFEQIKPEDQKWVKNYVNQLDYELKVAVTNNRNNHFVKKNINKETIANEIFNAGIIDPIKAIDLGLIDGIQNFDEQIKDRYSHQTIYEVKRGKKISDRLSLSLL